jgi:hypothetical protein
MLYVIWSDAMQTAIHTASYPGRRKRSLVPAAKTSNYEPQFAVFGPLIQTDLPITYFLRALSSICVVRNKTSQVNWDNFQVLPDSRTGGRS